MAINHLSRRKFIAKSFVSVAALPSLAVLIQACNTTETKQKEEKPTKPVDPCNDFSQVTETDLKARQKLGYVKQSPIADSKCQNCQLFLPIKDAPSCGKCQLFKGPVLTVAYCTYWAPQNNGG